MIAFLRVRQTWYPVDSIDQIDDVFGKMVISLASGHKVTLDPIEAERVQKQLDAHSSGPLPSEPSGALLGRMVALEAQVLALKAQLATLGSALGAAAASNKAKAKTNA